MKLYYSEVKTKKIKLEFIKPEGDGECLFAVSGLKMNAFADATLCVGSASTLKLMLVALEEFLLTVDGKTLGYFLGFNDWAWGDPDDDLFLKVTLTPTYCLKFTFKINDASAMCNDLVGFRRGWFSFQLTHYEISDFKSCLDDICWAKPVEILESESINWVFPSIPSDIGLVGRGVGTKKLVIRAAMYSDMRKVVSKTVTQQPIKTYWLKLLNKADEEKVGVCQTCGNYYPRVRCWEGECYGCHSGTETSGVAIELLDRVGAQHGGSHIGKI